MPFARRPSRPASIDARSRTKGRSPAGHTVPVAYEHSRLGRLIAKSQQVDARPLDLRRQPVLDTAAFDVAYCFEVAEHLDAPLGDLLVRFCAAQAPNVVFTAAPPGQGGSGHKNEQPARYWIDRFRAEGMSHDAGLSTDLAEGFRRERVRSEWLAENVMAFTVDAKTGPAL
jgi:hypothetical protein